MDLLKGDQFCDTGSLLDECMAEKFGIPKG